MDIILGCTVKDLTSGFTGIAVNRTEFLNGTVQYNIQPPAEGSKYPDPLGIDVHLLEVVDAGVSARATKSTYDSPIVLGNKVKCIVTGDEGIAIMKTYYLNGCAGFLMSSKIEKGADIGKHSETWYDQCRLVVTGKGIADKVIKPEAAENGKHPGGAPMRGIPRG